MRVHIIGAGVAGLSAATYLAEKGYAATLYEATTQAGGRCRSYHDAQLGYEIDNGNHIILSGNPAIWRYLQRIGATDRLKSPARHYNYLNLTTGRRWALKPPLYLPSSIDTAKFMLRLALADKTIRVAECVDTQSTLYSDYIVPLCVSALNTRPEDASATALRYMLLRAFGRAQPYLPAENLQQSFISPALEFLQKHNITVKMQHRLQSLQDDTLSFTNGESITLSAADAVLLALPAHDVTRFLPEWSLPQEYEPIINGHFLCDHGQATPAMLGLTGGLAQWLFFHQGRIATTTSASTAIKLEEEAIAKQLWGEIRTALPHLSEPLPPYRIITEKRATYRVTPQQFVTRLRDILPLPRLALAGDYMHPGIPTLENAAHSGEMAAKELIRNVTRKG